MLAGVAKLTIDNDCSPEDDDKGDDDEWFFFVFFCFCFFLIGIHSMQG